MGASSAEINEQIASTREHLDANLDVLEKRAASGAKRAGALAAIGLAAGLLVGGAIFLVYRRMHRPSIGERVQDALPASIADLPDELRRRFGGKPFKVVITSADAREEGGVWEATARKVAPAIATTAMSALMARVMKRTSEPDQSTRE